MIDAILYYSKSDKGRDYYNIIKNNFLDTFFCNEATACVKAYDIVNSKIIIIDLSQELNIELELIKSVKAINQSVYLMAISYDKQYDELELLKLGFDSYTFITNIELLIIKINKIINRVLDSSLNDVICYSNQIRMCNSTLSVTVNEKTINLTKSEFLILKILILNKDRIITRKELYFYIYGDIGNCYVLDDDAYRCIDTHIKNLRKKIGIDCIKTVSKKGYLYQ
jgi:DNA-binding response OmpR family regulator